jgi:hypothetical protein
VSKKPDQKPGFFVVPEPASDPTREQELELSIVQALAPGQIAALTHTGGHIKVVKCLGRTPEGYRPYQAVQRQVMEDSWDNNTTDIWSNLPARPRLGSTRRQLAR